ncbi:MAG: sulfur carrier protein ThiS [Desulfotalea sp.]
MIIHVNGEKKDYPKNYTIKDVLSVYNLEADSIIVEFNNGLITDHARHGDPLKDGDKLELVRFVGGG